MAFDNCPFQLSAFSQSDSGSHSTWKSTSGKSVSTPMTITTENVLVCPRCGETTSKIEYLLGSWLFAETFGKFACSWSYIWVMLIGTARFWEPRRIHLGFSHLGTVLYCEIAFCRCSLFSSLLGSFCLNQTLVLYAVEIWARISIYYGWARLDGDVMISGLDKTKLNELSKENRTAILTVILKMYSNL